MRASAKRTAVRIDSDLRISAVVHQQAHHLGITRQHGEVQGPLLVRLPALPC